MISSLTYHFLERLRLLPDSVFDAHGWCRFPNLKIQRINNNFYRCFYNSDGLEFSIRAIDTDKEAPSSGRAAPGRDGELICNGKVVTYNVYEIARCYSLASQYLPKRKGCCAYGD